MAFCDFHPHPAPPFPKHPQALACTSPHLRSHSAQCPPPGMPLPSTFQLARTRGNKLLTETSMGPNESIPHPLPLPALCEGLPQMGLSFPWRCGNQDLGVSALLPAVPSSVPGTGLRPRKQTPGQILEPSLPGARPCTCNLTFRTRSPPAPICQMGTGFLPGMRRWCVESVSLLHPKAPGGMYLACCHKSWPLLFL